jgi:ribonuclease HII
MDQDRFHHERELLGKGVRWIAGVDEAGRGPLAGPVVAAAVMFPEDWIAEGIPKELAGLNDSKQLSAAQRERFFVRLMEDDRIQRGISCVEAGVIDAINILQATHRGMNEALAQLKPKPEHALVDGTRVKTLNWHQTPLVKGDSLSYSIAAASVLAKVTRDRILVEAHRQWPQYGFEQHKGYPTREHLEALALHGPCPIHRRSFAPLKPQEPELLLNLD